METSRYRCEGCGDRLYPLDEVRALYRERADTIDDDGAAVLPRTAYTHLEHEPRSTVYRIIGRGILVDLLRESGDG